MENLVYLPIEQLHPHPQNPRKELGDLTELADSIKGSGLFQNLTVVTGHWLPDGSWVDTDYTVIIGHRRRAASEVAGLKELPCAIVEMSKQDQLSTMLLENMQRSDLTVYEQAQGFQMMIDLGDTPDTIAEKTGFSKKTVKRRLEMAKLNQDTLKAVSDRQISLGDFDKLAKIDDIQERNALLREIGTGNFNQAFERKLMKQEVGKRLPAILELLKTNKALKIKYSDAWNGKYKQIGTEHRMHLNQDVDIPTPKKGRLYYCLEEDYGRLRFYEEAERTVIKRPQAEIDLEKAQKEANDKLEQLDGEFLQLRRKFVESLRMTAQNKTEMFMGALDGCFIGTVLYSYGTPWLYEAFGIENRYDAGTKEKMLLLLKERPNELIPRLVYAAFNDENRERYHTTYAKQWPRHQKCLRLDILYGWLVSLGYQMSDDEKQLQDGTHQLLHLGETANERS